MSVLLTGVIMSTSVLLVLFLTTGYVVTFDLDDIFAEFFEHFGTEQGVQDQECVPDTDDPEVQHCKFKKTYGDPAALKGIIDTDNEVRKKGKKKGSKKGKKSKEDKKSKKQPKVESNDQTKEVPKDEL